MGNWLAQVQRIISWIIVNLDWIIGIVLSFAIGILGVAGGIPPGIIFATTLFVLGLLSIGALRDRSGTQHLRKLMGELEAEMSAISHSDELLSDRLITGISRVLPQTFNFYWVPYIKSAKHVTIIRLRHDYSDDLSYYQAFEAVLNKGGSVTLVMSDPRSPAMWLRYMEEPSSLISGIRLGEKTWVSGLEDLARVLYQLNSWKQRLEREGRDISKLSLKISSHYPTQAFYRFDNTIYVHSYPYLERGFHSPAFLFTDPSTIVYQFLERCVQSIIDSSVLLEDAIDDIWKKYNDRLLSDQQVMRSQIAIVQKGKDTATIRLKREGN